MRRKFGVTTDSHHAFRVNPNLARNLMLTDVEQLDTGGSNPALQTFLSGSWLYQRRKQVGVPRCPTACYTAIMGRDQVR